MIIIHEKTAVVFTVIGNMEDFSAISDWFVDNGGEDASGEPKSWVHSRYTLSNDNRFEYNEFDVIIYDTALALLFKMTWL